MDNETLNLYDLSQAWFPPVPNIEWDATQNNFADKIMEASLAVVIKNAPFIQKWEAFRKWSIPYFEEFLGREHKLDRVWEIPEQTIWRYNDAGRWLDLPRNYFDRPMDLGSFVDFIQHKTDTLSYFYYSDLMETFDKRLTAQYSIEDMLPGHKIQKNAIWLGSPGVTSQCHIDNSPNFYVHFKGAKRFIIFPPEAAPVLHLFPRLHPLDRRSSLPFAKMESHVYKQLQQAGGLEVTLQEGDMYTFKSKHLFAFDFLPKLRIVDIPSTDSE